MRLVVCIILFFLFCLSAYGQKVRVADNETGKPVYNVIVFNKSETFSATTNKKGEVDISALKKNEIVIFSHVSYAIFKSTKSNIVKQKNIVYLAKESEQLNEIVLSVFKSKNKATRIAEQTAVLTKGEIRRVSPQTSADLLAAVPGVRVQKSQLGGGSPVLRGMESNRVLLVVDGVRMNNAIYRKGHLQNSITVSPNQLDRTEIVFGPSSVIYGSDALGGVIHYYTKTPGISEDEVVNSSFFSRYSSVNNEITTNVSAELSFKKWGSFTSISYSDFGDLKMGKNHSHGFPNWGKVFEYSQNTNSFYSAAPTVNANPDLQRNTGYRQTDVLQKFYIPLRKDVDVKVNLQYGTSSNIPRFDRLTEIASGTLKFAEWYYGAQERLLLSSQLHVIPHKKWIKEGTVTVAYQHIKEPRIQRRFNSLDRSYRKEQVAIFSINGDFLVPLTKDNNRNLTYGFELAYNDVNSDAFGRTLQVSGNEILGFSNTFNVQSRYPDGGSNYTSIATYLGYRQDVSKNTTLNTGIRFTHTHLEAKWMDQSFIMLPQTNISIDNSAVTATLGYVYKPSKNWQFNSVLSSGFRSPNIDDIGRVREKNGNVTVPNIYLKPEFAYNAEIGIQKYFNDKKFRIGGNVYYTLLDNYIIRDRYILNGNTTIIYDGEVGNIVANQNRKTAFVTGFTTSFQGKISSAFNASGSVTYTKGRTYDTDEPLSSIPPLFGRFDVNFKHHHLEFGTNLRFNAKKDISDFNISEGIDNHDLTPVTNETATNDLDKYYGSPAWISVGLNSRYIVNANWTFQGLISNLFDQHYREFASGISAPGRNFSFSVIATF
ncbi:MAG: TonB-dependent receptor plug domain-containing protein [Flavobacteriaceae bacterium]|nr:MAG: TonB-dependent receptor plug domain-containing protein [Flavobacteriaceae bacterium]